MSCAIGVVAHQSRYDQARQLVDDVGADVLSTDHGGLGARANHLRVWGMLSRSESEWSVVLEDDADVSHMTHQVFRTQLKLILDAAPTPVVSLYLGTGNPRHWQPRIERSLKLAGKRDADWLVCRNVIHAVALAVRTERVTDMIGYLARRPVDEPIDESITRWTVKRHGVQSVSYSIPSLVDHLDGPTLIAHADRKPRRDVRKAWVKGTRPQWNSESVRLVM